MLSRSTLIILYPGRHRPGSTFRGWRVAGRDSESSAARGCHELSGCRQEGQSQSQTADQQNAGHEYASRATNEQAAMEDMADMHHGDTAHMHMTRRGHNGQPISSERMKL